MFVKELIKRKEDHERARPRRSAGKGAFSVILLVSESTGNGFRGILQIMLEISDFPLWFLRGDLQNL